MKHRRSQFYLEACPSMIRAPVPELYGELHDIIQDTLLKMEAWW